MDSCTISVIETLGSGVVTTEATNRLFRLTLTVSLMVNGVLLLLFIATEEGGFSGNHCIELVLRYRL